jgi:hypothetical protein
MPIMMVTLKLELGDYLNNFMREVNFYGRIQILQHSSLVQTIHTAI